MPPSIHRDMWSSPRSRLIKSYKFVAYRHWVADGMWLASQHGCPHPYFKTGRFKASPVGLVGWHLVAAVTQPPWLCCRSSPVAECGCDGCTAAVVQSVSSPPPFQPKGPSLLFAWDGFSLPIDVGRTCAMGAG